MIFTYRTHVNLLFGHGTAEQIGKETAKYGKKAMIVTGGRSTKKSGLLKRVETQLDQEGIEHLLFDKAQPNPLVSIVEEGAKLAKEEGCDVVIALGGGSVIDLSKGVCARAVSEDTILDMLYKGAPIDKAIPLIAVPTTCGTGSEADNIGVLTNDANNDKKAIKSTEIVPKISIVDPELMMTMPKHVYASVAFDALCHLMEAYLTKRATPMSDMFAMEGLRLMKDNILKVYNNYEDKDAWACVALASTLGGYTLDAVSVVAPHGMDHPIGGLRNAVHGKGLAAITPVIFKDLIPDAPERLAVISRMFGGTDEKDCYKAILNLLREMDMDVTLADLGFEDSDIEWLTNNCFEVSSWVMDGTPGTWDRERVERMYRASMTFNKEQA